MITSDILGKISVYDIKKFTEICATENYIPKDKNDELKVTLITIKLTTNLYYRQWH
jgi:hypothetical protein